MKRELKWFLWAFILPMAVLIGTELAVSKSPVPLWRRVLTLEDACAYGSCFIIPAVVFFCALLVRGFRNAWLRRD